MGSIPISSITSGGSSLIGGGGIRTRVPRCFKTGLYMLSRSIDLRLAQRRPTGPAFG